MTKNYTQHPLSAAFPSMSDADFGALVEDIRAHGQREPAIAIGDEVLDGWHRVSACEELGIEPKVEQFDGGDPKAFVLSKNLFRRQLDAGQRGRAVVAVAEWKPHGDQRSAPGADRAKSAAELAKIAHVSTRTVEQVKAAERAGLGEAIRDGKVSAKAAAEIAKAPELAKNVADGKVSASDAVRAIRASKPEPEPIPDDGAPDESELLAAQAAEEADRAAFELLLSADDKLATAVAEIKRLNAELSIVKGQRDGYQNEAAEWKRKFIREKGLRERMERKAA